MVCFICEKEENYLLYKILNQYDYTQRKEGKQMLYKEQKELTKLL